MRSMLEICRVLHPLRRSLVSDGMDQALSLIGEWMPASANYTIERYAAGTSAWTWKIPGRYTVHEAYLETEDGYLVCTIRQSGLRIVDYSDPVDAILTWEELQPHLFTATRRTAVPWRFDYYYAPGWGFCVTQNEYDALPRDQRYHAVIRSERGSGPDDGLAVGVAKMERNAWNWQEVLLCLNTCHIEQCNDSLTGVAVAIRIAERLEAQPLPLGSRGVRFLFCPETIGSIAYLAHHPEVIRRTDAGVCCEMLGTRGPLILQMSRDPQARITHMARRAMIDNGGYRGQLRGGSGDVSFRSSLTALNDEMVLNGPGVNIPTVALTRFPYSEYHTSDDTPLILSEARLEEAACVIEQIVRCAASDYIPRRQFTGPLFLSGLGLWESCRARMPAVEQIMLRMEGQESIFDISEAIGWTYEETHAFIEMLRERGMVSRHWVS